MTSKVELDVVLDDSQDIPQNLKEYADKHDVDYDVHAGDNNRGRVIFEADSRETLEGLIKYGYAPDRESEHQQYIDQIQGDDANGGHAEGESYLTVGTPEPRSDMDIHKPAPGEPDTQLEEAKAQQSGQKVDHVEGQTDQDKDSDHK